MAFSLSNAFWELTSITDERWPIHHQINRHSMLLWLQDDDLKTMYLA